MPAGLFGASVGTASGYMTTLYLYDRTKADTYTCLVLAAMVVGRGLGKRKSPHSL